MKVHSLVTIQDPIGAGASWVFKCALIGAAVAASWYAGYLQEATLSAIGLFAALQVLRPYFADMAELSADIQQSAAEAEALAEIAVSDVEGLEGIDIEDAGSVFKMLRAVIDNRGRMSAREATNAYRARLHAYWSKRLAGLSEAGDIAPMMGLGGSLLGLTGTLNAMDGGGGMAAMTGSLATMFTTTLAGCATYLVAIGLSSNAQATLQSFDADLEVVANQLVNIFDNEDGEPQDVFTF